MTRPLLAPLAAALALSACLTPAPDALPELCNAIDDDLDGRVDESACPGAEAVCHGDACHLACADGRGDADDDYYTGCECEMHNGGVEACNARDDDCDGRVDERLVGDMTSRQQGICAGSTRICDAAGRWGEPNFAAIAHFENEEATCDGLDNDCDGRVDESHTERCNARDDDCDGRVDEAACEGATAACADGACRLVCDPGRGDADRRYASGCECIIRDDGAERCNAIDDDCDGAIDEDAIDPLPASKQQGVCAGAVQICAGGLWHDPGAYSMMPGYEAVERRCDGLDNDCDGRTDEDTAPGLADPCSAGLGLCHIGGKLICDPADPLGPAICDAVAADIARPEVCNGEDDDCDGAVDEGLSFDEPCETGRPGLCRAGQRACVGGAVLCRSLVEASDEVCNGTDDDCDGAVDEEPGESICPAFEDNPGTGSRACGDARCVIARCNPGRVDLDGGLEGDPDGYRNGCERDCTPTDPPVESCNGLDDDCDGTTDEDLAPPPAERQFGVCAGATQVCGGGWVEPSYALIEGFEGIEATCDGLDNDCDGHIDEEIPGCDVGCDGIDDDGDGIVDEKAGDASCPETVCAVGTLLPPCNGCPESTVIPGADPVDGEWVCVPAGEFTLGSPDDEEGRVNDEGPQVPVAITRPLLVQTHEVTRRQWRAAFQNNPSWFGACGDNCPVDLVNWFDAAAYMNYLSNEADLDPCYALVDCASEPGEGMECDPEVVRAPRDCVGYRLPTEAEWEYAARGGTQDRFWSGGTAEDLARIGWYVGNSNGQLHPVCTLPAAPPHHPWGLCDVHGNVLEWTESSYGAYPDSPADGAPLADPTGPLRGHGRVFRGGAYLVEDRFARAAFRNWRLPGFRDRVLGFRPVRFAGPPPRAR